MVQLTLVGLSGDGKRLLLISDAGVEFTVDVDARLRAALRGDHARLGQLEIQMDSILRPRDIQARIRSGESPETVALAAQTTVEKIMPYAAPVLAEREHVAQRAQRASIRRSGQGATSGRTLGDAVGSHLRSLNVDPGGVGWDAWRREDGRWSLVASYVSGAGTGEAAFTFDAPGNYVSAEDEQARWLIGDAMSAPADADAPAAAPAADDLTQARRRRLAAVPPEELPLGEDALDLVSDARPADESASLGNEAPVEAYLDDPDAMTRTGELARIEDEQDVDEDPPAGIDADDEAVDRAADDEPPARQARRKGRASVPSWDEIMFGGGKHD